MPEKTLGRRAFLRLSALTAVSAAVTACGATPTATPVPPTATKPPAPTAVPPTAVPAAPTATKAPAAATAAPAPAATTAPAPAATAAPAAPAMAYKEAPVLADLVKAGKLPSVDKRLPASPRVITPLEKVGKYGGTWHRAYKGTSDRWGPTKLHEEFMMQWDWQPDEHQAGQQPVREVGAEHSRHRVHLLPAQGHQVV